MWLKTFWQGLDWSYLLNLLISAVPALVCITIHEMCHGVAAYRLGDNTPATQGRLSLNPLHHIDIMGFIMLVVFHFGWAKPVSVDMRNFKNPKRDMAITALAGPLSNFLLACAVLFIYGLLFPFCYGNTVGDMVLRILYTTAYLSVCLGLFNLIPIPPLDGSKVLFSVLPNQTYYKLMRYERYGMLLLFAIMLTGVLGTPISAASQWVFGGLMEIAQWGFGLTNGLA